MEHESASIASPWLGEEMVVFRMGAPTGGRAVALILADGRARAKEICVSASFDVGFARAAAMIRAGDAIRGSFDQGRLVGLLIRFKPEPGHGREDFESSRAIFGFWDQGAPAPLGAPAPADRPARQEPERSRENSQGQQLQGAPNPGAPRPGGAHWFQAAKIASRAAMALRAGEDGASMEELGDLRSQALTAASAALSRTDPEVWGICAAMLRAQAPCLRSLAAPLREQALALLCASLPTEALALARPHFA